MSLLYRPVAIIVGLIASILGRRLFESIWAQIDEEGPPTSTHPEAPLQKKLAAAAVQGIVFQSTKTAVDHYGARTFYYLTGITAEKQRKDKDAA